MKYCSEFNNVITFFPERIRSCCVLGNAGPSYYENYDGKHFDFEYVKAKKKEIFDKLTDENFDNIPCKNCFYLKDKNDNDNFTYKYSLVYLNNWTHCNCGCFYCDRLQYSKGKITRFKHRSQYYDVLPIIKGMYKHEMFDVDNLRVVFHGGDFSVLKEFESLTKTFIKNGVDKIDFSSNNIIYQPIVSDLLAKKKASLNMSLDCGSRETYKLIKRVDKFNDVIKNLKKYVIASKSGNPEINVKYIILKNVNDNEEEIIKFISLMKEIGITRVSLHLEHRYAIEIFSDKSKIPEKYRNLITLFFDLCKKNELNYDVPDDVMNYIITNQ